MVISVKVWEFSNGYWRQVFTPDHVETKDEYKYFRVMKNGNKEFYKSPDDYKIHQFVRKVVTVNNIEY